MDPIKKILQFGYGMAAIGKDNVKSLAKDLKKHYNLDEEQSKKLARDVVRATIDSQKEVYKIVKTHTKQVMEETGVTTRKHLDKLKKKISKPMAKKSRRKK